MTSSVLASALQINATGPMNKYINSLPEATLFNYQYKRITPFAENTANLIFNEKVDFGKTLTVELPFIGDLVHKMYVYLKLPPLVPSAGSTFAGYTNCIGYALIEYADVFIGNTLVSSLTGQSMEIMDYLSTSSDTRLARDKSVGRYDTVKVIPYNAFAPQDIYIPLSFWFTKKRSAALQILKLTGHKITIRIKLNKFADCIVYDGIDPPTEMSILDGSLITNYIMLSDRDKKEMLDREYPILIETFQVMTSDTSAQTTTQTIDLDFKFCVKELVWVFIEKESVDNNDFFNYGRRAVAKIGAELFTHASLFLDGKERCSKLPESYFRMIVPSDYHTFAGNRNIYVYSFATSPEINQPSGTANMSRFDRVSMSFDFVESVPACKFYCIGVSYNVLHLFKDGTAQVEFAT